MPQFFPDGPSAVNLNSINEQGGINLPPEPPLTFETPGMQGSMQQLLSENLGKFVLADFLIGISSIVRRAGILYSVGRSFLVLYLEEYHTFQVCDIFSLKFVSFFPPGYEPTVEQLLRGEFGSGILSTFTNPGASFSDIGGRSVNNSNMSTTSGMGTNGSMNSSRSTMNNSGSRTLGQR